MMKSSIDASNISTYQHVQKRFFTLSGEPLG